MQAVRPGSLSLFALIQILDKKKGDTIKYHNILYAVILCNLSKQEEK